MQTNPTQLQLLARWAHAAKQFLVWYALLVALLCLAVVLTHYAFSVFQPIRWPTKIYFFTSLFLALASRSWSTSLVIFILPLLPELHLQVEAIFNPAVKYFVGYPGVDVIAGFCVGQWFLTMWIEKRPIKIPEVQAVWPLGLILLVLSCSVALAITRNLWQSTSEFSIIDLLDHLIKFKFLIRTDNYYPLVDLIVFGFCALLIFTLLDTLKQTSRKVDLLFKPLLAGLAISASWGILQALTKFGLPLKTYSYRPENLGFGAQGFQPDLHAFAGHMLLGIIGLFGFIRFTDSIKLRRLALLVCSLCWVALILSKSRASLVFALLGTVCFIIWSIKNQQIRPGGRLLIFFLSIGLIISFVVLTNSHDWIIKYYELIAKVNFTKVYDKILRGDFSSFAALNALSSDRLELHGAALRMGSAYPFFGVGQGNFFRLSSILEFSGSQFMTSRGGENAHNYFLQTFAEVGLVGLFCFGLVFMLPILRCSERKPLLIIVIAILSVFAGNLYSHSLVIKENLFLLACLLALLFSYQRDIGALPYTVFKENHSKFKFILILLVSSTVLFCMIKEVRNSFYKMPFNASR
jgi:O-antigen ligase